MATSLGRTQPKADQPRVTTESLRPGSQPANLQYRVTGIKSFTGRAPSRAGRDMGGSR
jgi:hypothetical protein